jgi:hypothetical protein
VTANIIFGQMAPVGTGCCHLLLDTDVLERSTPRVEPERPVAVEARRDAPISVPRSVGRPPTPDEDAYVPSTP